MDSDRLAAILLCLGAILGLVGATPTGFTLYYAILGWASFGVVLLLGVFSFRNRREGRALAVAAFWFALLGGAASVALLILGLMIYMERSYLVRPDWGCRDGPRHRGRGDSGAPRHGMRAPSQMERPA